MRSPLLPVAADTTAIDTMIGVVVPQPMQVHVAASQPHSIPGQAGHRAAALCTVCICGDRGRRGLNCQCSPPCCELSCVVCQHVHIVRHVHIARGCTVHAPPAIGRPVSHTAATCADAGGCSRGEPCAQPEGSPDTGNTLPVRVLAVMRSAPGGTGRRTVN